MCAPTFALSYILTTVYFKIGQLVTFLVQHRTLETYFSKFKEGSIIPV